MVMRCSFLFIGVVASCLVSLVDADFKEAMWQTVYKVNNKGPADTKIQHEYKCKTWFFGTRWNHYHKYELESFGSYNGSVKYFNNLMPLEDRLCDYRPKRSYIWIKAQNNNMLTLEWVKFNVRSSQNDGPGFELHLELNELALSRDSSESDYDEIYIRVQHDDSHKYYVYLKRGGSTKRTMAFDNDGKCTNCLSRNYKGGSSNDMAVISFAKKKRQCTYYFYDSSSGSKHKRNIGACY